MKTIQSKTILDKFIIIGLVLLNTIFLAYWGILAYYSQLHYDDLHFLWKMREMSVFEYVKEMYFSRSGRFVSYAINGWVSNITDALGFHQLWAAFYYVLGIGACWLVIKDVKLPVSQFVKFMGICFLYNLYILTNIDFPVFFWQCAMGYYIFLPLACLLLKYLNEEKLKWWQWTLLVVITVRFGGGNETFTPIVLLIMFVNGMWLWHSKGWNVKETWALPQVRRIVWVAVALLVLWVIVVVAPGNYARMNTGEEFAHPVGILGWLKAMIKAVVMFFWFMAFYFPYYLVAFAVAYYLGGKSDVQLPASKMKIIMWMAIAFFVYLLVSALPNVYLYNGFGVQRNYTHVVFLWMLVIVVAGFVMGVGKKPTVSGWLSVVGILALMVVMCVNIKQDTPSARLYGKAVDARIERLLELKEKGQTGTVEVEPLPVPYTEDVKHFVLSRLGKDTPKSVLYYISETDTIPNEYEYHMKRVLDLDFDFVLAKEQQK